MLFNIDPTTTPSWKKLTKHHKAIKHTTISELFHQDKDRFEKYSTTFDDILVDYSKNNISDDAMKLLLNLAKNCKLKEAISACLLYTSDAADERSSVDLGGRRIIKKKTNSTLSTDLRS